MKKALSIILCLSMLMTSFPVSVFAAPALAPIGGETTQEIVVEEPVTEEAQQEAESTEEVVLAAEGTVSPVKVLPKSGTTVDYRYPVAYYTFSKDVEIPAENVTIANINNGSVGGVYFEEETNTIWVFPYASKALPGYTVSFNAWTSNIVDAEGNKLYFPAASFVLSKKPAEDGENLLPFGDNEKGWTPFYFYQSNVEYTTLEYLEGDAQNGVAYREAMVNGDNKSWSHNKTNIIWKPATTYKLQYKVKFASYTHSGMTGNQSVSPDAVYKSRYFCPSCGEEQTEAGADKSFQKCDNCGAAVPAGHASNVLDHAINPANATIGPNIGWVSVEKEFSTIAPPQILVAEDVASMHFSIYSNPPAKGGTNFYIDDVAIYEKVNMTFVAVEGKSELIASAPETLYGYNGDTVTLPVAADYFTPVAENYEVSGWTDGKNVYEDGATLTVAGCKVLTPVLVPTGEAVTVTFDVSADFAEYYTGLASVTMNAGETIDLNEFAFEQVAGYDIFWTDADGEKVSGVVTIEEDTTYTAVLKFREGVKFDNAEIVAQYAADNTIMQNATLSFDEENKVMVVTPVLLANGKYDPIVILGNIDVPTAQYAAVEVTLLKASDTPTTEGASYGQVFIKAGMNASWSGDAAYQTRGSKFVGFADEAQTKVIYRFDLAELCTGWVGNCAGIRFDAHDASTPYAIAEIKLIKDEEVEAVEIFNVEAPALSNRPDTDATVAEDAIYSVKKVQWDCESTYFGGNKEYTVNVTVAINDGVTGWMFGENTTATIDGVEATVEVNEDNPELAVVSYTFPATEEAKDIEVIINNELEITENNGTLVLDASVVPANAEDVINPTTVSFAITGGDEGIATLEGNELKAIWDGTVEIAAIPDYNAEEAVTFEVVISNQVGWNVTYVAGTGADVAGLPEVEQVKYDYEVSKAVPTRAGFGFDGWSLVPGGTEAVNTLYVEDDVTLYAMWSRGTTFIDFKSQSDLDDYITIACAEGTSLDTTGDGYLTFKTTAGSKTGAQAADVQITVNSKKNVTSANQAYYKNIPLDDVSSYEIRLATDYMNTTGFGTSLYFSAHDGEGNFYSHPYDSTTYPNDYKDYTTNMLTKAVKYPGSLDEFVTIVVDTTTKPDAWKGYLGHARFDPMQGESAVGKTIIVDYIRLNGVRAVDYVDVVLDAPVVSADAAKVEDVVASSDAYTIESIEWAPALIEDRFFDDDTVYTATITAKPATGYVMSDMPAAGFVNGDEADIEYVDGKLVVTYEFEKTADLADFELVIGREDGEEEMAIDTAYGTLQLRADAFSSDEITDPNFTADVYWSISDEHLATIDENGLVTANLDGTVTVTALSKYDPQVSATVEITLSNQEPEREVTFHKGAISDIVLNMPSSVIVKGDYVLPDVMPTRRDYHFEGWVTEPGGTEFVTETYIDEDTTFYAKWAKILGSEEFDSSFGYLNPNSNPLGVSSYTFEDGCVKMVYDGSQREGIKLEAAGANLFDLSVNAEDVDYVEMRFKIENFVPAGAKGNVAVYVMGTNPDGTATAWSEAARTNYEYDPALVSGDGFYKLRLPASWHSKTAFMGALRKYRIHFNSNNAALSQTVVLDYVRFVGKNVDKVELTDVAVPVTKAEAQTAINVVEDTKYVVTDVEWTPALLGGMFFDSATEYTVDATIKALGNYYLPNYPAVVTVNGEDAEYYREDDKTAVVSFTFSATEDLGEIALVNVKLNEKDNDGDVADTKQIIAGDDFNLGNIKAANVPDGYRWIGWTADAEGTEFVDVVNLEEDTEFYAAYELIEGFDFGNEYHIDGVTANTDGVLSFVGGWAVMNPATASGAIQLTTPMTYINAADYGKVEVIYDGSLETTVDGVFYENKFGEKLAPELYFEANGTRYAATLVEVIPCIVDNRVSYKYVYDMMLSQNWVGEIGSITLAPYAGNPAWAVKSINFVKNEEIEDAVVITGLDAPETWGTPDYTADVEGNFVLTDGAWSPALNESGKFNPNTAYTATIVVRPTSGYKIVREEATVNGNEAEAVINADGSMTVTYTFEPTAALIDFDFALEDGVIDVADGTYTVTPVFTPANEGETVELTDIVLEIIDNGDENNCAVVVDNNTIKAVYDGTITIKATSVYDPSKSATAEIVITNQVANYTITYEAGAEGVTNMPETDYAKLTYQLSDKIPVRSGYAFAGWIKNPGDTISITKDNVTSDTTYYALWVKGVNYEFVGETLPNISGQFSTNGTYKKEDGVYYSSATTGTDPQISFSAKGLEGAKYSVIEVRIKTNAVNPDFGVYFTSKDADGNYLSMPYKNEPGNNYAANRVGTRYTSNGEYVTVKIDMSVRSDWTDGYIENVRLDPFESNTGAYAEFDYIRLVNYETSAVELDGIDVPVAKAVADTDAVSLTPSAIKVVDVAWEPALLYDYYFDGDTEYTVGVTVTGAPGYFVSSSPAICTINGEEADSYEYNAEDGTLTVYKTFEATGEIDSSEAYEITLVSVDDDFNEVEEVRTIFCGDTFEIGSYAPATVPAGYRWVGWIDGEDGEYVDTVVVEADAVYYADYVLLTEFDYADPSQWEGTKCKDDAEGGIRFEDNLAIITVDSKSDDTALITPVTNLIAKNFSYVEVYYSATHDAEYNDTRYPNIFNATLYNPVPALKFSTAANPNSYTSANTGKLVSAERVKLDDGIYYKYTYDMTTSAGWTGKIGKLYLDPYNGYPEWGVRKIVFVPNEEIYEDVAVEVADPETWVAAAVAADVKVNAPYYVKSITWNEELNERGAYLPETVYSATISVGVEAGYTADGMSFFVNGNEVLGEETSESVYTFTYEFEATEALADVEVKISGKDTIATAGRYLQLSAKTVAVDDVKIPVTDVTWSVDDETIATVSEFGRVYPLNNGTVTVIATSVYDPSVYAEHTVNIVNQGELYTVTFNANAKDAVTGLPEAVMTRGSFVPEDYALERTGYFFTGWSVDEDALEPDASFNITKDTVLYAKWAKGYEWSCDASGKILTVQGGRKATFADGIAYLTPGTSSIIMEQTVSSLGFATADHKQLQVKISLPKGNLLKVYVQSSDGTNSSAWNESASKTITGLPANAEGEFQIVTFDLADHANWNQYPKVNRLRMDSTDNQNSTIAIDWIRLVNSNRVVKFDANGGLIPLYDGYVQSYKQTYSTGTIRLSGIPVREGYSFAGWSKNPDSFDKLYFGSFTVTDDVTLYAMWTPSNTYYNLDAEELADVVSVEEGEIPDDMDITSDKNGLHASSETEATLEVKVADEIEVEEANDTLVVLTTFNYAETSNNNIYLSFVPEGETEPVYVLIAEEPSSYFSGKIVADLSDVEEFAGTITDVKLVFQTGVINGLTLGEVAITTAEKAEKYGEQVSTGSTEREEVTTEGSSDDGSRGTFPTGGGTIASHANSTTVKPNKQVTAKPTTGGSTGGGSGSGSTGGGSTAAPAADYVVTKTSASGDIVFEFDNAEDEKLISSYRHMAKVSLSNSVLTIKNNGRPEGDKNSPAFFSGKMSLDAATHRYIIIKNNCTYGADTVRVYFTTDGKYSEAQAVNGVLSNATMGYTVIDMGANAAWKGTITGLFFSVGNKVGNIEIDAIIFSNNKSTVSKSDNKFPYVNSFSATTFSDVKSSDWFYGDVEKSYKIGLMNGRDNGTFDPNGNVTLAEAITVASRINALYNGKTIAAAAAGQKWYDTYVAYAQTAGIIKAGQFADVTKPATRSEVAVIFANAMPAAWYTAKNMFTSIPDVASSDAAYNQILTLYNAGVVVGSDDAHNFMPANNIKRSELSAIINRVVLPESRLKVYTAAELEKMTIYLKAEDIVGNVGVSFCEEGKLVLKDGLAYGKVKPVEGKNPDPIVSVGPLVVGEGLDASLYKTIEIGVKYGADVPSGTVANIFFTTPEISWSEKARVDAKYEGAGDANGIRVLKFNMAANANWKGTVTNFRFDPFNLANEFSIAYIKLVPTID